MFSAPVLGENELVGIEVGQGEKMRGARLVDLIAADRNSRSHGGDDVFGLGAVALPHLLDDLFSDSADGTSPARVRQTDRLVPGIDKKQRRAVGVVGDERHAFFIGDQSVDALEVAGLVDTRSAVLPRHRADKGVMILRRSGQTLKFKACALTEPFIVLGHAVGIVAAVESEVHRGELSLRYAAQTGGKGVADEF